MKKEKALLNATFEIMEELLQTDDVYEILSRCLDIMAHILKSDAAVVWIANHKKDRLYPLFHIGPSDIAGISVPAGSNTEGKCFLTGESIVINDTSSIKGFEGTVFDRSNFLAERVMCLPIKISDKTFGCFQIINTSAKPEFSDDEQILCERMAAIAAMSIDESGIELEFEANKKPLISLKDVTKEFPSAEGTVQVLKGINLDIYSNELIVILGESGCGKSTLLNIIGGMDQLTSGVMLFEENDYSHLNEKMLTNYRRNEVGFIFQSYNLMPNLTAKENLEFIAELVPSPMSANEALEKVGMLERATYFPSQLSGGQQQRIAIARALVKRPRVILADEPTAALDFETSLDVLEAIQEIVQKKSATVIIVTHNAEIAKISDRVIRLRSGRIASIKTNPNPKSARQLVW